MRSSAACVAAAAGERLEDFFCTGKSSIMSETCYNDVLGM